MQFALEADEGELAEKGDDLLKALAVAVRDQAPLLADQLEEAILPPKVSLRYPAMRELQEAGRAQYQALLDGMLEEILAVLEPTAETP